MAGQGMITKEHLAASMVHECNICIHLFAKFSPEAYSYRPSPQQRSTAELMQYLAICGIAGVRSMAEGNWTAFGELKERVQNATPEDFPALMEKQKEEITAYIASLSDEALATQEAKVPGVGVVPLGAAILNGPLKWLTAYRMQLFLYAKACGATDIGTSNAWSGMDMPAAAN